MYTKFDTIAEAYTHLRAVARSRQLWTIAWMGGKYFVFVSSDNPSQQMGKLMALVHEHAHPRMSSAEYGGYVAVNREIAAMLTGFGIFRHDSGHAEEDFIRHFGAALADAATTFGSTPSTIIIFNSDSPCAPADPQCSSTLVGWPRSCTEKLKTLAAAYPAKVFRVFYLKRYRARSDAEIGAPFAGLPNITIEPYMDHMRATAATHLGGGAA